MHICGLDQPETIDAIAAVMHSACPVFMLQMTSVHALIAPPSPAGVDALNKAKNRLPQKNYGTITGSADTFFAMANPGEFPSFIQRGADLRILEGAFVRVPVAPPQTETPVIRAGTHQALILAEPALRTFFQQLEPLFASCAHPALFAGHTHTAPLGSSANISGDPAGSIVDDDRAWRFGRERGIALWVRQDTPITSRGSYPIVEFQRGQASLVRPGPRDQQILRRLQQAAT